ncbi:MAG: DNA-3-methyladenine glycosylase 2 family protein [Rhodobacteraceae bacterium]|nr:DNA-3-methyladenine glycosylase 2 family protein [Paracoccaceae bacterium]
MNSKPAGTSIETLSDLEYAAGQLARVEPRFAEALEITGPLPLRRRQDGFTALLDMIVSQQVSVAAADAIWNRLESAGLVAEAALRQCSDEELRNCGLSRQKSRYARALAQAKLDYASLRDLDDSELVAQLTKILGIGVWTAEIYGMSALGRPDMIAAGDLALQESARILFELENRPKECELRKLAKPWSPWRSVAANILWAYYRAIKQREGIR